MFKALFFVYSKFIPSTAGYENNFLLGGTRLTVLLHVWEQLCTQLINSVIQLW